MLFPDTGSRRNGGSAKPPGTRLQLPGPDSSGFRCLGLRSVRRWIGGIHKLRDRLSKRFSGTCRYVRCCKVLYWYIVNEYQVSYCSLFPVHSQNVCRSGLLNYCAVALALNDLGYKAVGIRIDSGDLSYLSKTAREIFERIAAKFNLSWFASMTIVASNDINEDTISSLDKQVVRHVPILTLQKRQTVVMKNCALLSRGTKLTASASARTWSRARNSPRWAVSTKWRRSTDSRESSWARKWTRSRFLGRSAPSGCTGLMGKLWWTCCSSPTRPLRRRTRRSFVDTRSRRCDAVTWFPLKSKLCTKYEWKILYLLKVWNGHVFALF